MQRLHQHRGQNAQSEVNHGPSQYLLQLLVCSFCQSHLQLALGATHIGLSAQVNHQ
jgi:LSD1 subclass zinc finger protein